MFKKMVNNKCCLGKNSNTQVLSNSSTNKLLFTTFFYNPKQVRNINSHCTKLMES